MNKSHKLSDARFQQADYTIGRYAARVPVGTTLDDVMHPEFFQHNLHVLRPGTQIDVLSDDFELDCRLRVLTVHKTTAKCRVLDTYNEPEGKTEEKAEVSEVEVTWGGPNQKWRVVHAGEIIEHGFASKEEAQTRADAYAKEIEG